jgi:hypothetical protein
MIAGMIAMLIIVSGLLAMVMLWAWRRLADHLKDNPEGVAALTTHLFVPLLGKKPPEEKTEDI